MSDIESFQQQEHKSTCSARTVAFPKALGSIAGISRCSGRVHELRVEPLSCPSELAYRRFPIPELKP